MPTEAASSAVEDSRVSSPPTATVPPIAAGTLCGTSPLRVSPKIDLPQPEGPRSSSTSPGAAVSETPLGRAAAEER
ncbi:hypothetical protein HDA36_006369 [Nocardiopsis composta]|uniref:Uncharacterized protein n=1 Tax=Nocardiopsis composta TaxID=157465 RepID=A0A7W8QV32_9ACTN|nr:hypothetical protein [Nocardiopsis composta]MBB5436221.1 hypothetical protein [Nocardiopsis composta]